LTSHTPTHTPQDDLICLPAKLASSLGGLGPLVLVSRVTSSITLLDPLTLRTAVMDAPVYWRTPFKSMLTSRALVEYVVLDIEPLHGGGGYAGGSSGNSGSSGSSGKWCLTEAQVARKSDFGRNDTVFFARTHLGNILHPGEGPQEPRAAGCGTECSTLLAAVCRVCSSCMLARR
jgi:nonsense-mediated mRNA decay protein 3